LQKTEERGGLGILHRPGRGKEGRAFSKKGKKTKKVIRKKFKKEKVAFEMLGRKGMNFFGGKRTSWDNQQRKEKEKIQKGPQKWSQKGKRVPKCGGDGLFATEKRKGRRPPDKIQIGGKESGKSPPRLTLPKNTWASNAEKSNGFRGIQ